MDLNDLYTQVILEHSRNQENKKEIDADLHEPGHNPSCGDEIELEIKLDGDKISDAAFTGHGCAISQASTSIMCDQIKGKTLKEAKEQADIFIRMIRRENVSDEELEEIGDAAALQNVSNMPARVKCALLAWRTLDEMIKDEEKK
ncbi:MAG: SUF system NifU family Fe-S cluster assembly protein [Peptoniphilaceae bacterium]|nr:SUF system NifU family Fe-S cluster assembly protein [Peptoniphilaceae bacterium]MDD7383171.1 SUF system NifU family Fe-S cluster assembly protein [Peptoniphilaceae bacterium]MDY3738395.1 SUF system NifU family Fe-S cluster assembly protein [Peptoniphilaceae bacterium]